MKPLTTVLVGAGGMGRSQAAIIASLPMYHLAAVVDLRLDAARSAAEPLGAQAYDEVTAALRDHRPDVVAICTSNAAHAAPCLQAAAAGVRGIYCEKPMAIDLGEARAMVEACARHGSRLVVNHQRRTGADLRAMRAAIDGGAIGKVRRIRCQNAGDLLSDGTHAIDSMLYLAGDTEISWLLGQCFREDPSTKKQEHDLKQDRHPGWRFGHPVEDGFLGEVQFSSGVRGEILCGACVEPMTAYQTYEVIGTLGSLWRPGDGKNGEPKVYLCDGQPGTHAAQVGDWPTRPLPAAHGLWRPLPLEEEPEKLIALAYRRLADWLAGGPEHPMSGRIGLRDMEVVMGLYESARLGRRLTLPISQERFPLTLMVESEPTAMPTEALA